MATNENAAEATETKPTTEPKERLTLYVSKETRRKLRVLAAVKDLPNVSDLAETMIVAALATPEYQVKV